MPDKKLDVQVVPGELAKLRLVPTEPIPEKLFVCSAKIDNKVGVLLRNAFNKGTEVSRSLTNLYNEHLVYTYGLGEKALFYEAGPSVKFDGILYIFATDNMEDSKKLMHGDPFHKEGIFYDDSYFEWHIHSPLWKSHLPPMPEQEIEVKVDVVTPQHLFVAFGKFNVEPMKDWMAGKAERPIYQILHLINRDGTGGMGTMGFDWALGPSQDVTRILHIFAVPSLSMAQFVNETDALYRWGLMSDFRYFEWCIHFPLRKASPQHKDVLKRLLGNAGIKV
jgi:hypothetical protein